MTVIYAPASSANLGPGFDVLGVALTRHVWAADCPEDMTVTGENARQGIAAEPCGPDHIARLAFEAAGGNGDLFFDFGFPPGRGLGFSAAARAAGATLAYLGQGHELKVAQERAYEIVNELEGHGDNAAPAVFGGMHIVAPPTRHRLKATIPGTILCWVPDHATTATDDNRAAMEPLVNRSDAVFNLGRLGLLMAALYEADASLLAVATDDRLHQGARLDAAPKSKAALEAAMGAGARAAWLSGSGPTVAIVASPDLAGAVQEALPNEGCCLVLEVDEIGATPSCPGYLR